MNKSELRTLYRTVRSHIGEEYAEKAAEQAAKRFLKTVPLENRLVIAGYAPTAHEFNVTPLLTQLLSLGHQVALPAINGQLQPLLFREWHQDSPLQPNAYNIQEPTENAVLLTPDIILTPLLACDKKGGRLGYGKGFYDITLAALRANAHKPLAIGLCYHVQLADFQLPTDETDQKLDIIVTEKQVIHCNA